MSFLDYIEMCLDTYIKHLLYIFQEIYLQISFYFINEHLSGLNRLFNYCNTEVSWIVQI